MADEPQPQDNYEPPRETAGDQGHMMVRTGIASVPGIGAYGAELFNKIIVPPLERRRDEWRESVATGLRELEDKFNCVVDDLKDNDTFIDAVMQASHTALRTSQQEKLEALRNAVLNAALPDPPEASRQATFIHFVDTLTVWHIRLLRLFAAPLAWFGENGKAPRQIGIVGNQQQLVSDAFPELASEMELVEQYISDLQGRGLISKFKFPATGGQDTIYAERGTKLGIEFLGFITLAH